MQEYLLSSPERSMEGPEETAARELAAKWDSGWTSDEDCRVPFNTALWDEKPHLRGRGTNASAASGDDDEASKSPD
jgi:hypothetical protein